MSTVSASIPVEELWRLYAFNPLTGKFYKRTASGKMIKGWRDTSGRAFLIQISHSSGRIQCNYGRAVYAWCTGTWPEPTVDHIDRDPANNRFHNLRPSTHRQQNANRKNSGGQYIPGALSKPWKAQIRIDGKLKHLGYHATQAEAQQAYQDALKALGTP